MRWIDIVGRECTQFFSAQARIIRQGKHHSVAKWLLLCHLKNSLPLLLVRHPGQFLVSRDEPSFTSTRKSCSGRVATSADRIVWSKVFFHQVVVEEPDDR